MPVKAFFLQFSLVQVNFHNCVPTFSVFTGEVFFYLFHKGIVSHHAKTLSSFQSLSIVVSSRTFPGKLFFQKFSLNSQLIYLFQTKTTKKKSVRGRRTIPFFKTAAVTVKFS